MERQYVDIPLYTTINEISFKNYSLSATQYKSFRIKNTNLKSVKEFLSKNLTKDDLGCEVGSDAYVDNSSFFFIKTKALQEENYLLNIDKESVPNIKPKSFLQMNLKKGDLLISKDSNVGEIVILDKDYPNMMICGGLYRLPVTINKFYLLAFIKSKIFRQQIDFLVPRGSTIRHGKTKFLDCLIPLPNNNEEETIKYVELLMQAIINKEILIKKKHKAIIQKIRNELLNNQTEHKFYFNYPCIREILNSNRLDSGLYSKNFKEEEFILSNYKNGTSSIYELGFRFVRGNNLAVSVIGASLYSDVYNNGMYSLIMPKNFSDYGTVLKKEFLGNKNKLLEIRKGAIIFGAEGTFRSTVLIEDQEKAITNFHGLTLYQEESNLIKSIFVKLMLDYFREYGICKSCATGGNGGSLSIEYWKFLKFPNFPTDVENEIVNLYHNKEVVYDVSKCTLKNFIDYDSDYNITAGIYELEQSMIYLKSKLNKAIDNIANDVKVNINF